MSVGALDRLQTILDGASVGIVHIDEVGHALHSNPEAQLLLGYSGQELLEMTFPDVIHPDHLEEQLALHAELVAGERAAYELEKRYLTRDGHELWAFTRTTAVPAEPGTAIVVIQDITERKHMELALLRNSERLTRIVETQRDIAAAGSDLDGVLGYIVECAMKLTGSDGAMVSLVDGDELVIAGACGVAASALGDRRPANESIVSHAFAARDTLLIRDTLSDPRINKRLQAQIGDHSLICVPLFAGDQPVAALNVFGCDPKRRLGEEERQTLELLAVALSAAVSRAAEYDAKQRLIQQSELNEYQALHDGLTGLANRTLFRDRIELAIRAARRDGKNLAVAVMDLDRFKEVNDSLGHAAGDALLVELGGRLAGALRDSDTVARLGGDEFGLLLPGIDGHSDVLVAIDRVRTEIARPVAVEGLPLVVEGSIGIAVFPDDGDDVDTLVQHADVAMYHAKDKNAGWTFYDAACAKHDPGRLTLVGELRRALERHELILHYQPKALLADGQVRSVEALVRWQHPERGLVPPDEFIPLVQQTGLIQPLTRYVIDAALRQVRTWSEQGWELSVAVNLSTRNLLDNELPEQIGTLLARHGVDASMLELEITESTMLEDPARTKAILERLSAMGIRLSIDDFGTGYSSLSYLKRLPVDEIKIDRSFVMNMVDDEDDATIVRSTIDLGRNLGLEVVAEGVESGPIWDRLSALGCTVAQGYFLSRPLPADELTPWLSERSRSSSVSAAASKRSAPTRSA
jgi:diguanylate cyclase (GGDEF)-like protein/PAS domain S-box-containing protein